MKLEETTDSMRQLEQEMTRAVRIRTMQSLAEGTRPHDSTERIGVDLGAVVKAQGDTVNTLITQLSNMMTKSQSAAQDSELRQLRDELKDLKTALTSGGDPTTVLLQSMEVQDKLAEKLKARLGLPEMPLAGGSGTNLPALIQLKQMDMDAAERDRQWKQEREEQRRHWEREDQRWAAEFGLKRDDSQTSRKTQERAGDAFVDLAGAVMESIDKERGVAGTPGDGDGGGAVTYMPRKRVRKPRSFRCECGAIVTLAAPADMEATCAACGAVYDMVVVQPEDRPAAAPPPQAPVGVGTPEEEERSRA